MKRTAAIAIVLVLAGVASASAAWRQPVGGVSPINLAAGTNAGPPSLTAIGGVPYLAWAEGNQVGVARLNADGTAWQGITPAPLAVSAPTQVSITSTAGTPLVAVAHTEAGAEVVNVFRPNTAGTGWDPVGSRLSSFGTQPSMTTVAGVPYITWIDTNGGNKEVFVAHLNSAGNGWVPDRDAPSPINVSTSADANAPGLADVGGVPWVAWHEAAGAQNNVYVAKLTGSTWTKVPAAVTPVDKVASADAQTVSLTAMGGVPWISWAEQQGSSYQIRVARFDSATDAWVRVADSISPINADPARVANETRLNSFDGVPYVAWHEVTATGTEIRVARLNSAGTGWERLADSPSPINQSPSQNAGAVSLANVGGIPFVAWKEPDAGGVNQVRVSRLEPEFQAQSVSPGSTTATASATWHTYGLRYPIGFDYGSALEHSTTPALSPLGEQAPTITQEISGLSPSGNYQLRSYATAPVPPKLSASSTTLFQTSGATDMTPPETTITKDPKNKLKKSKAKYKFISSEPNSTFVCKFDKKKPKPCDAGKAKYKRLDDGKHKFKVYAVDAAGNRDRSPAKDKFKVL